MAHLYPIILSKRGGLSALAIALLTGCLSGCSKRGETFERLLTQTAPSIEEGEEERAPLPPLIPIDPGTLCQTPRDPCRGDPCFPGAECVALSESSYECGACPEGTFGDGVVCRPPRLIELSELDYDQPGADDAEFIEIVNRGEETASMEGLTIELFNGENDQIYRRIALEPLGELGPGALALVAGSNVIIPPGVPSVRIGTSGFIQNGPDAILLVDAVEGRTLDTLVYGGALDAFPEEAHASGVDTGEGSLIRLEPGGPFIWTCEETPGAPNVDPC